MSLRIETPRVLSPTDMYIWWCKEKIRKRRHLKIKYQNTKAKDTVLVSKNSEELSWLRKNVIVLASQIEQLEIQERGKAKFTKAFEKIFELKRELYEANERIKHLEKVNPDTEQEIMSERTFRNIINSYNLKIRDYLIDGEVLNMKQRLGYIYIQRIQRGHPKMYSKGMKSINWKESNEYKEELIAKGEQPKDKDHPNGKNWLVYYTDDFYLRYGWTKKKGACRVKNHNYYAFYPSLGRVGAKKALSNANKEDELLYKKYHGRRIYYPKLKETA